MRTSLLLIRHGQTDWNVKKKWQGHADIPLNETGFMQANKLAKRLSRWPITAIISSDLQRCVQTAQAVSTELNLPLLTDPIWRERDVGAFSGMTGEETQIAYPEVWAGKKRGLVDPPNGEMFVNLQARSMRAYEKVLAEHAGKMVVVVSHGGLLHTLISQLIEIPGDTYGRISKRGNTGISIVEVKANIPILTRLNDTSHLE